MVSPDKEQQFREFIVKSLEQAQTPDPRAGRFVVPGVVQIAKRLDDRAHEFEKLVINYAIFDTWLPTRKKREGKDYLLGLAKKSASLGISTTERGGIRSFTRTVVRRFQKEQWQQRDVIIPKGHGQGDPHLFLADGSHPKGSGSSTYLEV
jgi:hypothetical protein